MNEDTLTVTQAAKLLRVSRMTIYRLIAEGKLRPLETQVYHGRGPRWIPRVQVEALLPKPSD